MSIKIELNQVNFDWQSKVSQINHEEILQSHISLASILSGQILAALEWQEFLVHAISYLPSLILTLFVRNIPRQLQLPEIGETELSTKVDVREADLKDVKIIEQAGKKGGKKKSGKKESDKKGKSEENNDQNRKEDEEKRQKEWEECWNKKLEAQEALEDEAFCSAHGFYPKPKIQTNVWVQVSFGKLSQDVQFCFKKDLIPKPPPPPLLPLKIEEESQQPAVENDERKKGKRKGKKK